MNLATPAHAKIPLIISIPSIQDSVRAAHLDCPKLLGIAITPQNSDRLLPPFHHLTPITLAGRTFLALQYKDSVTLVEVTEDEAATGLGIQDLVPGVGSWTPSLPREQVEALHQEVVRPFRIKAAGDYLLIQKEQTRESALYRAATSPDAPHAIQLEEFVLAHKSSKILDIDESGSTFIWARENPATPSALRLELRTMSQPAIAQAVHLWRDLPVGQQKANPYFAFGRFSFDEDSLVTLAYRGEKAEYALEASDVLAAGLTETKHTVRVAIFDRTFLPARNETLQGEYPWNESQITRSLSGGIIYMGKTLPISVVKNPSSQAPPVLNDFRDTQFRLRSEDLNPSLYPLFMQTLRARFRNEIGQKQTIMQWLRQGLAVTNSEPQEPSRDEIYNHYLQTPLTFFLPVALSPDGTRVAVIQPRLNFVAILDTGSRKVLAAHVHPDILSYAHPPTQWRNARFSDDERTLWIFHSTVRDPLDPESGDVHVGFTRWRWDVSGR